MLGATLASLLIAGRATGSAFARSIALSAALMCAVVSSPALAQVEIPTGSRVGRAKPASPPSNPALSDEDRALRTTFDYASCLVRSDEKFFRSLLSLEPRDFTEKEWKAMVRPACLRNADLRMPHQIFRGALYRAFYLKDQTSNPNYELGDPVNYYQFIDNKNESQIAAAMMLDFASCVVRADHVNVRTLARSYPGEAAHEAALQAVIPQLGPCMLEGMNINFSKSNLLAYLFEALYWESTEAN